MSQENENRESNSTLDYPIEKRTNGEAIFAAFVSLFMMYFTAGSGWSIGGLFMKGLGLLGLFGFIVSILAIRETCYVINCPVCGKEIYIATNKVSWECSECKSQLIIKDEKIVKL